MQQYKLQIKLHKTQTCKLKLQTKSTGIEFSVWPTTDRSDSGESVLMHNGAEYCAVQS